MTLTATFCFSVVLVHERQIEVGIGVAEWLEITTPTTGC